jgi:hypothetical protein
LGSSLLALGSEHRLLDPPVALNLVYL